MSPLAAILPPESLRRADGEGVTKSAPTIDLCWPPTAEELSIELEFAIDLRPGMRPHMSTLRAIIPEIVRRVQNTLPAAHVSALVGFKDRPSEEPEHGEPLGVSFVEPKPDLAELVQGLSRLNKVMSALPEPNFPISPSTYEGRLEIASLTNQPAGTAGLDFVFDKYVNRRGELETPGPKIYFMASSEVPRMKVDAEGWLATAPTLWNYITYSNSSYLNWEEAQPRVLAVGDENTYHIALVGMTEEGKNPRPAWLQSGLAIGTLYTSRAFFMRAGHTLDLERSIDASITWATCDWIQRRYGSVASTPYPESTEPPTSTWPQLNTTWPSSTTSQTAEEERETSPTQSRGKSAVKPILITLIVVFGLFALGSAMYLIWKVTRRRRPPANTAVERQRPDADIDEEA